ncbi:MAG: hypothetical protein HKM93_23860, partial [Desulfobacteraceae bacterium]|nr:hypothetical protein [Desulfobacteraceae bacterium]
TAVPSKTALYYDNQLQSAEENVLIFPIYSALLGVIRKLRPKEPVAVVLQHSRYAELVVGDAGQVYFADRCTAFDTSPEQIRSLWEAVRADIETAETEYSIRVSQIHLVDWIDSGSPPEWTDNDTREWIQLEKEAVISGRETYETSFFNMVRMLSSASSTSPASDKFMYYAKRLAPFFNLLMLAAAIGMALGIFWYKQQTNLVHAQILDYRQKISRIEMPRLVDGSRQDYEKTLGFVQDLALYQRLPSYRQMINEVAAASFPGLELDVFKAEFSGDTITLEVYGMAKAPFDAAHSGYQRFLVMMKSNGYSIETDHFDTAINESTLLVKLVKKVK